jgi:hypothetical protein
MEISKLVAALGGRTIAVHPVFLRLTGSASASIFLSQAIYWQEKMPDFFYKTQSDWESEIFLKPDAQLSARKKLVSLGFLREKKAGIPAKTYYFVDLKTIAESIILLLEKEEQNQETRIGESPKLGLGKAPNKIPETTQPRLGEQHRLIQETTQEINQKTTTTEHCGGCDFSLLEFDGDAELAKMAAATLPREKAQQVLDELVGRIDAGKKGVLSEVQSPASVLRKFIKSVKDGSFTYERGAIVAKKRESAKRYSANVAAAWQQPPEPAHNERTSDEKAIAEASRASMFGVLGMRKKLQKHKQ